MCEEGWPLRLSSGTLCRDAARRRGRGRGGGRDSCVTSPHISRFQFTNKKLRAHSNFKLTTHPTFGMASGSSLIRCAMVSTSCAKPCTTLLLTPSSWECSSQMEVRSCRSHSQANKSPSCKVTPKVLAYSNPFFLPQYKSSYPPS